MAGHDEFTIQSGADGGWEVHWPDGSLVAVYRTREEAELVASTPELVRKCDEPSNRSLPFAYHLEYVLRLCEPHGSCGPWRRMRRTMDDIKETAKPKHPAYEEWAAKLLRPRTMRLRPFKDRGKPPAVNGPDPLPELHTLTDDEIEVFQTWFPKYQPGDPIPNELEAALLHDLRRSAPELPELTVPQITGLLRRASGDSDATERGTNKHSVTVFYSWQSDLPNHLNRGFIEGALKQAASEHSTSAGIDIRVDQDTRGLPGSPDVFNAILEKIRAADAFVGDVSFVGRDQDEKGATGGRTPNPNVLVELGYALAVLGAERIVMVFNTAFGEIRDLPFDLGSKRQVAYHAEGDKGVDRSASRKTLAADLKRKLEEIVQVVQRNRMVRRVWDNLRKRQRSFGHLRRVLGNEYTDEFFTELLKSYSAYFVSAGIAGGKPGLRHAPNAPPEGPGRLIKLA